MWIPEKPEDRYYYKFADVEAEISFILKYGDRSTKIELLKRAIRGGLTFQNAKSAVTDPDPIIRLWMAKNGSSLIFKNDDGESDESHNLWEVLRADEEEAVRIAVLENIDYGFQKFSLNNNKKELFLGYKDAERFAVLRNPMFIGGEIYEVLRSIFDHSFELFNKLNNQNANLASVLLDNPSFGAEVDNNIYNKEIRTKFWDWISQYWDNCTAAKAFKRLKVKARPEAFKKIEDVSKRKLILEELDLNDHEMIKVGLKDPDEECREVAQNKKDLTTKEPTPLIFKISLGLLIIWLSYLNFKDPKELGDVVDSIQGGLIAVLFIVIYCLSDSIKDIKKTINNNFENQTNTINNIKKENNILS